MPLTVPPEIRTTIAQAVDWLWDKYGASSFEDSTDFQHALYHLLDGYFNLSELRDLCFQLTVDYENLNGENKRDKSRELVFYCQRNGLIENLKTKVTDLRPEAAWPHVDEQPSAGQSYETKWRKGIEKYYTSLFERVGFVRILGRMESEPLENVFTHVNVLDKLTAEQRYDIARLAAEFSPRDFGRLERVRRVAGDEAVAEFPKLFDLGKPGAGKTTFLKHTALRAIKHEIKKVPLFVTLKELSDSGKGVVEFMTHQLSVHRFPEPEAFLARLLENGDALVLFDGLDEVNLGDDKRATMIQQINDFVYRYSDCPTLMTCRIAATDYSFTQFEYVEMADFDTQQMATYIDLWFVGDGTKRDNFKKALLKDGNYKPVRELAQVPLLLALLCLVYEERNEIPPERHEIYEEAMRALLSKWDASRNISRDVVYQQLSLGRKQKMLATIAAQTFEQGDYFLKEKEVVRLIGDYLQGVPGLEEPDAELILQSLEAQHGIFVERARGIHSFSHLTLQEYFTARYIVDNEQRGTVARLMAHVGDDRWREVFMLVAGMLDDATQFGELYLAAVPDLLLDEAVVLARIHWAAQKGAVLQAGYKPIAHRAFLHNRALARVLAHDLIFSRTIIRARALASARDLAFELAHHLAYNRTRDLDFVRDLNLARDLTSARVRDFARDLDLALAIAQRYDLPHMEAALKKVTVPEPSANNDTTQLYYRQLSAIVGMYQDHWDLCRMLIVSEEEMIPWLELSPEQVGLLQQYYEANLLLMRCIQVAYLPVRQEIEDKLLLLPEMW